jgi:hypothetical protein
MVVQRDQPKYRALQRCTLISIESNHRRTEKIVPVGPIFRKGFGNNIALITWGCSRSYRYFLNSTFGWPIFGSMELRQENS